MASKKISELELATSLHDACCFPLVNEGETKRVEFSLIKETIVGEIEESEQERQAAEEIRQQHEATRQSNETARGIAEADRIDNESDREYNEGLRQTAESARNAAESNRQEIETTRISNETARGIAEADRIDNEILRVSNETSRITAESTRSSSETTRVSNETTRQSNEEIRQANEEEREEWFESASSELANKANKDGTYDELTSGNAKQIVPTVFMNNKTPYNFRTTASLNDVGDRLSLKKLVGGSVVLNQLVEHGNFDATTGWEKSNGNIAAANNVLTYTVTDIGSTWYYNNIQRTIPTIPSNHKVLAWVQIKPQYTTTMYLAFRENTTYRFADAASSKSMIANTWNTISRIINTSTYAINKVAIGFNLDGRDWSIGNTVQVKNVNVIDLTVTFGPEIANYLATLTIDQALAKISQFINTGKYYEFGTKLLSTKASTKINTEVNQWDEQWENGYYDISDGTPKPVSGYIRSKSNDYIKVIPNVTYYLQATANLQLCYYDSEKNYIGHTAGFLGTRIMPSNCHYIRFYVDDASYGGIYKNDICINFSHNGSKNGIYYPSKKHEYSLGDDVLRGLFKLDANNNIVALGDEKTPDGSITRKYGIVDLGSLTWTYNGVRFNSSVLNNVRTSNTTRGNWFIIGNNYTFTGLDPASGDKTCFIGITGFPYLYVYDSAYTDAAAFKAAMSGVYLVYELATPTTEEGTPYQETQIVNDWGTEEIVCKGYDEATQTLSDIDLPSGHDSDYWYNLRDKLEGLPDKADSNGDYLVRQTNGKQSYIPYVKELPSTSGLDSTKTYGLKFVNGTLSWVEE